MRCDVAALGIVAALGMLAPAPSMATETISVQWCGSARQSDIPIDRDDSRDRNGHCGQGCHATWQRRQRFARRGACRI